MLQFLYPWLDAFWIPVAMLLVHEGQRLKAGFFVIVCMIGLRLQVEIMEDAGFRHGITKWIGLTAFDRGLIVYSLFIGLFIVLAIYSPRTRGPIFLAACLSLFFMAMMTSTIFMIF